MSKRRGSKVPDDEPPNKRQKLSNITHGVRQKENIPLCCPHKTAVLEAIIKAEKLEKSGDLKSALAVYRVLNECFPAVDPLLTKKITNIEGMVHDNMSFEI